MNPLGERKGLSAKMTMGVSISYPEKKNGPIHENSTLMNIAYAKTISLCMYSQLSSSTINLFFGMGLHPMTILCLCEQRTLCAIAQAHLRYRCSQLRLLPKPHELSQISNCYSQFFVCVYGLRPSQQFFTCVGTLTR